MHLGSCINPRRSITINKVTYMKITKMLNDYTLNNTSHPFKLNLLITHIKNMDRKSILIDVEDIINSPSDALGKSYFHFVCINLVIFVLDNIQNSFGHVSVAIYVFMFIFG